VREYGLVESCPCSRCSHGPALPSRSLVRRLVGRFLSVERRKQRRAGAGTRFRLSFGVAGRSAKWDGLVPATAGKLWRAGGYKVPKSSIVVAARETIVPDDGRLTRPGPGSGRALRQFSGNPKPK
jgi:hypothetical protein